jgi:hypothetical protein
MHSKRQLHVQLSRLIGAFLSLLDRCGSQDEQAGG